MMRVETGQKNGIYSSSKQNQCRSKAIFCPIHTEKQTEIRLLILTNII